MSFWSSELQERGIRSLRSEFLSHFGQKTRVSEQSFSRVFILNLYVYCNDGVHAIVN